MLIANWDDCDAGFVGERFRAHGYSFVECMRERPGEWPELSGFDLVLLLGSEWSVYWPRVAREVDAEQALIRAAHSAAIPTFGICFGGQSIAAALGGIVGVAARPEIGWATDIASDVPDAIPAGPWMQWHSDAFTVPPGAVELARSPVCSQAFRIGRTMGTQFHPEVTEAIATRWALSGEETLRTRGATAAAWRAESSWRVNQSGPNAHRLVDWYLEQVAGRLLGGGRDGG